MEKFIWEPLCYDGFKETIIKEIFEDRMYEKYFEVEEGDVVFDIGASLGPFTYSILHKNPSHVFTLEPSYEEFKTLVLNTRQGPVTHINKGISNTVGEFEFEYVFNDDNGSKLYSTTFSKVISDYNIKKIDFLKSDCEGGEYDIFNIENLIWIKENVKKISGEWHLRTPELKQKFREFRDIYLRIFPNHEIYSFDGINIKWDLWSEHFIDYYEEVIIYIDNR
jgi:FkbM family methyltransferase